MILSKNEVKVVRIWWPTRMLICDGHGNYQYRLVKFGEKVAISPRKPMGAVAPTLSVRSMDCFMEAWFDSAQATFESPDLSTVSIDQIGEFLKYSRDTRAYETHTDARAYVLEKFASIL